MVVRAATGNDIAFELRHRIFDRLPLRDTTYATSSRIRGAHVHGYLTGDAAVDVTALSPTVYGASGAMVSTADDVARFYGALLRGRLLRPAQLRAMRTIDPVATGG